MANEWTAPLSLGGRRRLQLSAVLVILSGVVRLIVGHDQPVAAGFAIGFPAGVWACMLVCDPEMGVFARWLK